MPASRLAILCLNISRPQARECGRRREAGGFDRFHSRTSFCAFVIWPGDAEAFLAGATPQRAGGHNSDMR